MSAPNYAVMTFDLSVARTAPGERIINVGEQFDAVAVLGLPGGATVAVAFGASKPAVPLVTQGQAFDLCPVADEGLYVVNPIGAGLLILLVSFSGVGVTA